MGTTDPTFKNAKPQPAIEQPYCKACQQDMTRSGQGWICTNDGCVLDGLQRMTGKPMRLVPKPLQQQRGVARKQREVELSRIDDTPDTVTKNRKRAAREV